MIASQLSCLLLQPCLKPFASFRFDTANAVVQVLIVKCSFEQQAEKTLMATILLNTQKTLKHLLELVSHFSMHSTARAQLSLLQQ